MTEALVLTDDHIDLIKRTIAPNFTDTELKLFLHVCRKTQLDPLMRQIHAVKRHTKQGDKVTFQIGIDGYRLIADRTGRYAGSDDSVFLYADDDQKGDHPLQATVTVWKLVGGVRCSFTATARWSQYYPGNDKGQGGMWLKMPHVMLAKCAEALALRKAFPAELSGLYVKEEMEQAGGGDLRVLEASGIIASPSPPLDDDVPPPTDEDAPPPEEEEIPFDTPEEEAAGITEGQRSFIHVLKKKAFPESPDPMLHEHMKAMFGLDSVNKLTKNQAHQLIDWMLKKKA